MILLHYHCDSCNATLYRWVKDGATAARRVKCLCKKFAGRVFGSRTTPAGTWPLHSDAFGCHPKQIPELRNWTKEQGCPTEYTPDGRAILRDRAHRKALGRAMGYYDKQGGYGDP